MKGMEDLESAFALELDKWFKLQTRDPHGAYYLYFKRTTENEAGSIMIDKDAAPGYEMGWSRRIGADGWDVNGIKNFFRIHVLRHLPVLEI